MLKDGDKNRGYELSSIKAHKAPRIVQDSPKESYILCPDCERYFSFLEEHASSKAFNGIRDFKKSSDYLYLVKGIFKFKSCLKLNPRIFQLFFYSVVWRCSITSENPYRDFKLEVEFEERIRDSLFAFRVDSFENLHKLVSTSNATLTSCVYSLMTYEGINDATTGAMGILSVKIPSYRLALNEYWLIFTDDTSNADQALFSDVNNTIPSDSHIKIGIISKDAWAGLHKNLTEYIARLSIAHVQRIGAEVYRGPE